MIEISPYFYDAFDPLDENDTKAAEGLVTLFNAYITKRRHQFAGKDVPYHKPPNTVVTDVNLRHVHLKPLSPSRTESEKWTRNRTSDRCLVYARSECGRHLLIAYLHENAHAQAYDNDYIKALAKIAEGWLYSENIYPDMTQPF